MTDIVERLRHTYFPDPLTDEAADEITRLRVENDLLFEHLKGNGTDLELFNQALALALARHALEPKP